MKPSSRTVPVTILMVGGIRSLYRQLRVAAPVFEGAVVEVCVVTEVAGDEIEQASLLTDVTIGSDAVALLHSGGVKKLSQSLGALEFIT